MREAPVQDLQAVLDIGVVLGERSAVDPVGGALLPADLPDRGNAVLPIEIAGGGSVRSDRRRIDRLTGWR